MPSEANGIPAQAERDDIGEIVSRVGEKREAVGKESRPRFYKDESQREEQRQG